MHPKAKIPQIGVEFDGPEGRDLHLRARHLLLALHAPAAPVHWVCPRMRSWFVIKFVNT